MEHNNDNPAEIDTSSPALFEPATTVSPPLPVDEFDPTHAQIAQEAEVFVREALNTSTQLGMYNTCSRVMFCPHGHVALGQHLGGSGDKMSVCPLQCVSCK
jgi:hypothetical protein